MSRAGLGMIACTVLLVACSGAGDVVPFVGDDAADPCELIDRMADSAGALEDSDLADPDDFAADLDAAIEDLADTLDELADAEPELREPARRMRTAVEQRRFDDAVDARAAIDTYAARECA